jgi:uncharacterized membrane protein YfcA
MMIIEGLIGSLAIGLSLGLLGSGGSILTIPVLVFLLKRPEKIAIAEGLAIVCFVSLIGAIPYGIRKQIGWKSVFLFGVPGMVGACAGGGCSFFISGSVHMILFALAMVAASGMMLFGPVSPLQFVPTQAPKYQTILKGFFVGLLTGLLGIGGGFLIVPALILLCSLPAVEAIGTSLMIIAMNALVGFLQQVSGLQSLGLHVNWSIIGLVSLIAAIGSFSGSFLSSYLPQTRLKKLLGCSIFAMGLYVLIVQS